MPEEFTCGMCGGTFTKGRSDEEAVAEMVDSFGELPGDEALSIVCDECYQKIRPDRNPEVLEAFHRETADRRGKP
jgi:hypothetical protein